MYTIDEYLLHCELNNLQPQKAKNLIEYVKGERRLSRFTEYTNNANRTINTNLDIDDNLINGVMGLNGESGEVIDLVKKYFYQGHDLDRDKIVKECGDTLWYLNLVLYAVGSSLEECANLNIQKLRKRYPKGFNPKSSIERVDTYENS